MVITFDSANEFLWYLPFEINSLKQYFYVVPFVFQDFPNWNFEILPYFVFNLFLE